MGLDQTGAGENVEQPQRVETPPPPPPDRPGSPGAPSRAESRAAAQDNGQSQADQPKEQPSASPPESVGRDGDQSRDKQDQKETSTASDQGDSSERDTRAPDRPYSPETGTPDDAPGRPDARESQPGERAESSPDTSEPAQKGEAESLTANADAEAIDGPKEPDRGASRGSDAEQDSSDQPPTAPKEQAGDARRETSDQPNTETQPQQAGRDTDQNTRPETSVPDRPPSRSTPEAEQATSLPPDTQPDAPDPARDASEAAEPAETVDGQALSADQFGDPDALTNQTEPATEQPDRAADTGPNEETDRSRYRIPYDQFIADSYGLSKEQVDEAINQARKQRENNEPDSDGKEGDATKPPTGEELLDVDEEKLSRAERFRKEAYEKLNDISDVAAKTANSAHDILKAHPPTGHAETSTRPEFAPAPHEGIDAGEMTTGLLAIGIVVAEGINRLSGIVKRNRRG